MALHDQVMPSLPSSFAMASARGKSSVNVSSSKKNSFTCGNALFAASSSTHGLLSVVSWLASLYPVVTVLLARLLLGERVQRTQDAGVLVALVGVVLITAGG